MRICKVIPRYHKLYDINYILITLKEIRKETIFNVNNILIKAIKVTHNYIFAEIIPVFLKLQQFQNNINNKVVSKF